ncbi:MAG: 50S ribosomal protein L29 [Bacteroidia bacterium]|nr:50S ribosomal protein L29 [Bacteroidia bacterium]
MNVQEIRELSTTEIVTRIKEEQDKLLRLRLNHAVSAIENPSQIRESRKTIARLYTIMRERQLTQTPNQ